MVEIVSGLAQLPIPSSEHNIYDRGEFLADSVYTEIIMLSIQVTREV